MRELNPGEHWYEIGVIQGNGSITLDATRAIRDGRMVGKKVDIVPQKKPRTIFFPARSYKAAMKWARKRFRQVVFCHKVDTSYRLHRIEYLRLKQDTIPIQIEKGEFEVGVDLGVNRSVDIEIGIDNR